MRAGTAEFGSARTRLICSRPLRLPAATEIQWIDAAYSFQNIILVGGGAFLFKQAVKEAFPKHKIHEVKDPMYANVRGFQIAGMNYAASMLDDAPRADEGGCVAGETV